MNWGYRILALYLGFVALIVVLVVLCVRQTDIHLVSKEYYRDELAYQQRIEALQAAPEGAVQLRQRAGQIELQLAHTLGVPVEGQVTFFRPSDARKDVSWPLELDSEGRQTLPAHRLAKGLWRVQVRWTQQGKPYYQEKTLVL